MTSTYLASISHFVPELLVVVTMMAAILLESTFGKKENNRMIVYLTAVLGLVSSAVFLCQSMKGVDLYIFTNSLAIDSFSSIAKMVMILGTIGSIYLAKESKDIAEETKGEFVIIASGVLVGGMLLVSATNMLILYIGIETLSILSYVMASMKKSDERSSEAGLKYSLYGGISAGIMLFGMSHIFGVLGSINFIEIAELVKNLDSTQLMILVPSFLLFFVGLGYKISSVPFHMWTPDVYEGSPLPVTTFFSIVPKVAGIGAVLRITFMIFNEETALGMSWMGTLSLIAALTMTVGNITAINQKSVKRMLAYSSISHAGFMLLGVLVISKIGISSVLFYTVTYLFMTLAAFYILNFVNDKYGNEDFDRFKGLVYKHPLMAIIMSVIMFSLAGMPPLSGFVAKFNIFSAIISERHYTLAVIAGINSVISLYYYLKIVRYMIFCQPEGEEKVEGFGFLNQSIIFGLAIPVILLGIFWSDLIGLTESAKLISMQ